MKDGLGFHWSAFGIPFVEHPNDERTYCKVIRNIPLIPMAEVKIPFPSDLTIGQREDLRDRADSADKERVRDDEFHFFDCDEGEPAPRRRVEWLPPMEDFCSADTGRWNLQNDY